MIGGKLRSAEQPLEGGGPQRRREEKRKEEKERKKEEEKKGKRSKEKRTRGKMTHTVGTQKQHSSCQGVSCFFFFSVPIREFYPPQGASPFQWGGDSASSHYGCENSSALTHRKTEVELGSL